MNNVNRLDWDGGLRKKFLFILNKLIQLLHKLNNVKIEMLSHLVNEEIPF